MPEAITQQTELPSPFKVTAAQALATVGALSIVPPQDAGDRQGRYLAASLGGAAIGGGIVGYVASSDYRGAATGALLTSGLAGLSGAFGLYKLPESRKLGLIVGGTSVLALAGALVLAVQRGR